MKLCDSCQEKAMCDQVIYDCPLRSFIDVNGFSYKFTNSNGENFTAKFKSTDDAKEFGYRVGLCFMGRL